MIASVALCGALLCGCGGSSISQAEKQARIKAALTRLQVGFEREKAAQLARAWSELKAHPVTGLGEGEGTEPERREAAKRAETLVKTPPPKGVTAAEWGAAIARDERLRGLVLGATASGGPTVIQVPTPAAVRKAGGRELAQYERGKQAVAASGCLACHKIGASGNPGPGPDLTEVAGRLPRQAIARTLVAPVAPMPSFEKLPREKFDAVVDFLAQLK